MHQAWGVKHRRWLRKYWRPVSLAGGAMIAAIPVAVGLNQVYLAYFRPLLTHRLDGMWCVADVVRQSHNPDFVGMEVKFILHLEQDSDGHLSGNGRKALGNGALPPPVEISSLAVQKGSSVSGSDVRISFVEGNDARPERRNLVGTSSGVLSTKILWSALSIQPQPVRAEIPGLGEDDVDRSGHHRCRTIELPQALSEWLDIRCWLVDCLRRCALRG